MASSKIKLYYWPMLARGAPHLRMLEHCKAEYEYFSSPQEFASVTTRFGSKNSNCFAPPVVVDGDYVVSQSTASCLYLGNKLGLNAQPKFDACKAMQFMLDIVDTFEANLGKNNEDGAKLKAFLSGDRFAMLMSNLENAIIGPFYFGDSPSSVDFFLAAHLDWRNSNVFGPLKEKYGEEHLAAYPKVASVYESLSSTDAWKSFSGVAKPMGAIKEEVLEGYGKL